MKELLAARGIERKYPQRSQEEVDRNWSFYWTPMSGLLLDSDILSVFAKVNALPLLCELLGCDRLPITTGVF